MQAKPNRSAVALAYKAVMPRRMSSPRGVACWQNRY